MTGEHLDWDNLRYFLAVARAGKLTAAARRLGQDHTTVGRRIASLESAFHSKLFERRPDGYRLTEAGQRLLQKCGRSGELYLGDSTQHRRAHATCRGVGAHRRAR